MKPARCPGDCSCSHEETTRPVEGTNGLTDDQIATIATTVGVPASVVDRFSDGQSRPWIASVSQRAFGSGVQETPAVMIDGVVLDGGVFTTGPVTKAIELPPQGTYRYPRPRPGP